ncbi:ABC transporter permease [Catenulispora pinisilvae]|uniref:ABC transporter permease n=1 Tax=Catenulispora pinisilvae TaxID=2705253 RepID=UPI0018924803|nr:ABC transporter permease [Catenulispora pinisilvae]
MVLAATLLAMVLGAWLVSAGFHSGYTAADRASFDPGDVTLRGVIAAQLLVGALGVVTVTGEYTSGLIRATFIATPQRRQVLAMKALIFTTVVGVWCTGLSFVAFFVGRSFLTAPVPPVGLGDPGVPTAVLGGGLYLTGVGLFGVFLGALLRRTAAALAALVGVMMVLPVVLALLPGNAGALVSEYSPAGAGFQIWHLVHSGHSLGAWPGFALFTAYAAATAAAAFVTIRRRDV